MPRFAAWEKGQFRILTYKMEIMIFFTVMLIKLFSGYFMKEKWFYAKKTCAWEY